MGNLTREDILARKTGRSTATLPDGSTVGIRALTRDEVLRLNEECTTTEDRDNYILATGMTDPVLSVEDVALWAKSADAGDLVAVSEAIARLSKLVPDAGKARTSRSKRTRT